MTMASAGTIRGEYWPNHGVQRGNKVQALARWRHPVAQSEALDVLYWAMRPALYRRIRMAIEIACDSTAIFVVAVLLLPITINHS
jgi:hypothetical protein